MYHCCNTTSWSASLVPRYRLACDLETPRRVHWQTTLKRGYVGSTAARRSAVDKPVYFLQPIQLHLQAADLLVQRGLDGRLILVARRRRVANTSGKAAMARFFQWAICTGWTPNADANSLNVRSPRRRPQPLSP